MATGWVGQALIPVSVWVVTVAVVARWRFTTRRARMAAVWRGLVAGLALGLPVAPLSPDGPVLTAVLSLLNLPALAAVWVGLSPRAIAGLIGALARRCRGQFLKWLLAAMVVGTGWIPFAAFGAGILGTVRYIDLLDPPAATRLAEAALAPQTIWLGTLGFALGLSAQIFLMAYLARAAVRLFLAAEGAPALPSASPLPRPWLIAYGCLVGVFFAGFASMVAAGMFHIDWGTFHAVI